jgi:hypothetical protein
VAHALSYLRRRVPLTAAQKRDARIQLEPDFGDAHDLIREATKTETIAESSEGRDRTELLREAQQLRREARQLLHRFSLIHVRRVRPAPLRPRGRPAASHVARLAAAGRVATLTNPTLTNLTV